MLKGFCQHQRVDVTCRSPTRLAELSTRRASPCPDARLLERSIIRTSSTRSGKDTPLRYRPLVAGKQVLARANASRRRAAILLSLTTLMPGSFGRRRETVLPIRGAGRPFVCSEAERRFALRTGQLTTSRPAGQTGRRVVGRDEARVIMTSRSESNTTTGIFA